MREQRKAEAKEGEAISAKRGAERAKDDADQARAVATALVPMSPPNSMGRIRLAAKPS